MGVAGAPPPRDRATPAGPALALAAGVFACFVFVQARYLRPPMTQDAMHYFERAAAFPDIAEEHWSFRIGLLFPLRASQWLFGYSEAAYYAFPLVASAVLVVATFWLGQRLFSPVVGVGAAVLLLLHVEFLRYSSGPLPDHVATALFVTALCLVVAVVERPQPWGRSEHVLLVGAGLLLGWGYLARELLPLLFVVVAVAFWCYRAPWRELRWVAAPPLALFVGESILNAIVYGEPFVRLVNAGSHGGQRDFITDTRFDALVQLPRTLFDLPAGPLFAVLTCVLPLALFMKRPAYRIVVAWFLAYWIPLTLGTGLVSPSFRFIQGFNLRYWMPVMPAILLGGLALVNDGARAVAGKLQATERARSLAGAVAVGVLVIAGAVVELDGLRDVPALRANGATQLEDLRTWLEGEGSDVDVLWTDSRTARVLPFFVRSPFGNRVWDGEIRAFDVDGDFIDPDTIDEGAIVLYPFGYHGVPVLWADIPEEIRHLKPGWARALDRDDDTLLVYVGP